MMAIFTPNKGPLKVFCVFPTGLLAARKGTEQNCLSYQDDRRFVFRNAENSYQEKQSVISHQKGDLHRLPV